MNRTDKPDSSPAMNQNFRGSLRDFMAAAALQGILSAHAGKDVLPAGVDAARMAYGFADAMLAEREKPQGGAE